MLVLRKVMSCNGLRVPYSQRFTVVGQQLPAAGLNRAAAPFSMVWTPAQRTRHSYDSNSLLSRNDL